MIQFIPLSSIIVSPNRQRKVFNADTHQELVESLQYSAIGLQNAIVVRLENGSPTLVSGERRLRAITDIYTLGGTLKYAGHAVQPQLVPCVDVGYLSEIDRMEAELQENILREDLTWQERAAAEQKLLELRTAQALARGEPPPTIAQFAAEVNPRGADEEGLAQRGDHIAIVSNDLILARHLDDPDVQAAKTPKEAMKVLKHKERKKRNEEMAAIVGKDFSKNKHTLLNVDSLAWMADQPDGQFDVILTDPPYGMGADEFGDSGVLTVGEHQYEDSYESWLVLLGEFVHQSVRITKQDAHAYIFCDYDNHFKLKTMMETAGWKAFRTPLIWYKPATYRTPWVDKGPRRTYECILYAVKGEKKVNKLADDVLTFKPDENIGHNAQKPVDLFVELLSRSAGPGQKVLDPFCGSGPIFPAAHKMQCYATGCEQDPASFGLAAKRLEELE